MMMMMMGKRDFDVLVYMFWRELHQDSSDCWLNAGLTGTCD